MDYNTICTVIADQVAQNISKHNLDLRVTEEVKKQVEPLIEQIVKSEFDELKENFRILNKQVLILKEAIESIANKYDKNSS